MGPEQGVTCLRHDTAAATHTATHGVFGALAFGICLAPPEVEHVP